MSTFSDLLATDHGICFRTEVSPIYQSSFPDIEIRMDDRVLFQGPLKQTWNLEMEIGLLHTLKFEIELKSKIYDPQNETAVVVNLLDIDDFSLIPGWTHVIQYDNDHGYHGPTTYVGFVGVWRLCIDEPFYRWRHRITGQGWLLEP